MQNNPTSPPETPSGASEVLEAPERLFDAIDTKIEQWIPGWGANVALQATVHIVLSVIFAMIADWILTSVVRRWARKTSTDFDDRVLAVLHGPIFTSVLTFGLYLSARRLDLPDRVRFITFGVLASLLVLLWFLALTRLSVLVLGRLSEQERPRMIKRDTLPLFENLAKVLIFGIASYLLILVWNADVTGWLASAGIVGIAVGFAAKDTLANLFSGVFIIADAPYRVGDYINLDTGERGEVTEIGLRSTRLLTRDDVEVTIPNSVLGNAKIVNESGGPSPNFRVRVKVGVAYGSDVDQVQRVLMEVAAKNELVLDNPEPRVRFRSFGGSSLDLELLVWVAEPVLRGRVLHELNIEVYKSFAREHIEIPYSKHDLYVKEMPPSVPLPEGTLPGDEVPEE